MEYHEDFLQHMKGCDDKYDRDWLEESLQYEENRLAGIMRNSPITEERRMARKQLMALRGHIIDEVQ